MIILAHTTRSIFLKTTPFSYVHLTTNNWFDITTVTLASPTTPTYQNFNGVFNNVRFSVANDTGNTGTIDKILYRN